MKLLHCSYTDVTKHNVAIRLIEHIGHNVPGYIILSHRWRTEEIEYRHLHDGTEYRAMRGWYKIENCARLALREGIEYIWVDTCCIDKSSSAELAEAINSMFRWYRKSHRCYAYLDDVDQIENAEPLQCSEWFTRGWTLQEMLAPRSMRFYMRTWIPIGDRNELALYLSRVSHVGVDILLGYRSVTEACIAEKMSWASLRMTTRKEDMAYSLMGLFGVHMPPLYGEGDHAFQRLQAEIMKSDNDHSIFAWQPLFLRSIGWKHNTILAESPKDFGVGAQYWSMPYHEYANDNKIFQPKPDYNMTNAGLHIQ